ncbi:MAG TPA: hypothetical protein VLL30_18325, partial [Reyranella sp.]|nr:hypothetical protein [Reyranella sp.]
MDGTSSTFTKPAPQDPSLIVRLIVTLHDTPDSKGPRFTTRPESGEIVVDGHDPALADGARTLLARGYHLATPLTLRHAGKSHEAF